MSDFKIIKVDKINNVNYRPCSICRFEKKTLLNIYNRSGKYSIEYVGSINDLDENLDDVMINGIPFDKIYEWYTQNVIY